MPDERDELTEEQKAIFQKGTDIGELAQQLFAGGIDASVDGQKHQLLSASQKELLTLQLVLPKIMV